MNIERPEIPFRLNHINIEGYNLNYFDEGKGPAVLISHGIPEWSLLYADLIKELSKHCRCVVVDHLGFGFSNKDRKADLAPAAHARRLLSFAQAVALRDINLYVHDLGGPIGIGALVSRPELFKSLTISNSFLWSLDKTPAGRALKMMQGIIGKWLYLDYGFSVKFMAKNGFADKNKFAELADVFMYPHQTKDQRFANYRLMLEMLQSADYYEDTLKKLKALDIPVQILWGMQDKFFDATYLNRWKEELPGARIIEIPESGHFPQIEATKIVSGNIKEFLAPVAVI